VWTACTFVRFHRFLLNPLLSALAVAVPVSSAADYRIRAHAFPASPASGARLTLTSAPHRLAAPAPRVVRASLLSFLPPQRLPDLLLGMTVRRQWT
jgi:hypothetical protein